MESPAGRIPAGLPSRPDQRARIEVELARHGNPMQPPRTTGQQYRRRSDLLAPPATAVAGMGMGGGSHLKVGFVTGSLGRAAGRAPAADAPRVDAYVAGGHDRVLDRVYAVLRRPRGSGAVHAAGGGFDRRGDLLFGAPGTRPSGTSTSTAWWRSGPTRIGRIGGLPRTTTTGSRAVATRFGVASRTRRVRPGLGGSSSGTCETWSRAWSA